GSGGARRRRMGLLVVAGLVLLWRSFCELYVALFRLSDDLHALRQAADADQAHAPAPRTSAPGGAPLN
ncbi:MAG: hypothetical protein EOP61_35605, partial [Sphingomonadales bacterium]